MILILKWLVFTFLCWQVQCVFAGKAMADNHDNELKKPLVLLISIDGFKPDYLDRGLTPTLNKLALEGTMAKGLISSFPSVTFPNHYTIVTGLRPDHNGIVNNTMYDSDIPDQIFKPSLHESVTNPQWWEQATPIWVTAKQQGKISSTLFWTGTETAIHGIKPNDWLPYDDKMTSTQRVNKLLGWLDRPDSQRADFATLYFSEVDHFGHEYGPDDVELNNAVERVDNALSTLLEGLEKLTLSAVTTLIIVSDHGMAEVADNQIINIKALLKDFPNAHVRWTGAYGGIDVKATNEEAVLSHLNSQHHMTCWPKNAMPERFGFGTNRRIPAIFCLAQQGWFITDDAEETIPPVMGMHGYDPALKDMQGLFIATGYRIEQSQSLLAPFKNVDIYPLLLALLNIKGLPNDGDEHLLEMIKVDDDPASIN